MFRIFKRNGNKVNNAVLSAATTQTEENNIRESLNSLVNKITDVTKTYDFEVRGTIYRFSCTLMHNGEPISIENVPKKEIVFVANSDKTITRMSAYLELCNLKVEIIAQDIFDKSKSFNLGLYSVCEQNEVIMPIVDSSSYHLHNRFVSITDDATPFNGVVKDSKRIDRDSYSTETDTIEQKFILLENGNPLTGKLSENVDLATVQCNVYNISFQEMVFKNCRYEYSITPIGIYTVDAVSFDGKTLKLGQRIN